MPHCEDCGVERPKLHRHHIVPKGLGGTNDPSNIIHICPNCHEDRHASEEGRRPWQNGHTPEAKAKRSATMRAKWTDEEYRRKHGEAIRRSWQDPTTRQKRQQGVHDYWDGLSEEQRARHGQKISATKREHGVSDLGRQTQMMNLAKGWDPEVQAKARAASVAVRRGKPRSDAANRQTSDSLKRAYAEGRRTRGHSEETRRKISEAKKTQAAAQPKRWSIKYDRCVRCGRTDHPHDAQGYCKPCYRAVKASGELVQKTMPSLKQGRWSLKFDACGRCGRTDSEHKARGVCSRCYQAGNRERRATTGVSA